MSGGFKAFKWRMKQRLRWPRDILYCAMKGLKWDPTWRLLGMPCIQQEAPGSIHIGRNFSACSRVDRNDLGVSQPVVIRAVRSDAKIVIGDDVGISGASICALGSVVIGSRTLIGRGVIISDSDSHPLHPDFRRRQDLTPWEPVVIGENVFVGAHSIVLKGVKVGNGAVIGAASVVTKDVPDYAIVAGNPARVVGDAREVPAPQDPAGQPVEETP